MLKLCFDAGQRWHKLGYYFFEEADNVDPERHLETFEVLQQEARFQEASNRPRYYDITVGDLRDSGSASL